MQDSFLESKLRKENINIGDIVVHRDYGISKFAGVIIKNIENQEKKFFRLFFKDNDMLLVEASNFEKISKYKNLDNEQEVNLTKFGSKEWSQKKEKIKNKIKDIAESLIENYQKRKNSIGFSFSKDTKEQLEMENSFEYEETQDQLIAIKMVKEDMEKNIPMDRLICADVGFGKTEIAIRAAFKATFDKKQVVVLVPTTVLVLQHYKTFCQRLEKFNVKIDYLCRLKSKKDLEKSFENIKNGTTQIIISTNKIFSKQIEFKDLGLLILDEEQKFGVESKEKIKDIKSDIDILTMSATPIPRTMRLLLIGAKDVCILKTPPKNRKPIETIVCNESLEIINFAISRELERKGQSIIIQNDIKKMQNTLENIQLLFPKSRIEILHAKMKNSEIEYVIKKFFEKNIDVLIATTIIESGVDLPTANTIIVMNSERFGLSDLHQIRGRVGRSNIQAYCYFLTENFSDKSNSRLEILEKYKDLGDGFDISTKDLDHRGAGDLFGTAQSGFICDVGFDVYFEILKQTVDEIQKKSL